MNMKSIRLILIIIISLTIPSCDKIKNKGLELYEYTEDAIKIKSKDLSDKIFPIFDSETSNTKYNKERFNEYMEIELTDDIDSIYSFGDFLGSDYKILISFKCAPKTIDKIVKAKNMKLSEDAKDNGLLFSGEFKWWDKDVIEKIQPYVRIDKSGDRFYLWYNMNTQKAYYEQFSL